MDWNKLQHTLYDIEPSDPSTDRQKLAGQGDREMPMPSNDLRSLNETADISSDVFLESDHKLLETDDNCLTDLAALAGIELAEAKKRPNHARGSDKMPKAKAGRTKHPLKGKLVGEKDSGMQEGFKDAYKAGKENYNTLGALTKGAKAMGDGNTSKSKARGNASKTTNSSRVKTLDLIKPHATKLDQILGDPRKKQKFELFLDRFVDKHGGQSAQIQKATGNKVRVVIKPYAKELDQILSDPRKKQKFNRLIERFLEKYGEQSSQRRESDESHSAESIKESLYRQLRNRK